MTTLPTQRYLGHTVVANPLELTPGKFSACFSIHEGDSAFGPMVHQRGQPTKEFDTRAEAITTAHDDANDWINNKLRK
ncbi:MAG: hypothetical protein V4724_26755 [Pseudomonadota bacterium]